MVSRTLVGNRERTGMARRTILFLLFALIVLSGTLQAESSKTITLKIFDGKSGKAVVPTGFQVRADHQQAFHNDWVKPNEDGTAVLTIPDGTHEVALHLAYDDSMEIYVACDADKNAFGDVWYLVPQVLDKGFVAANGCAKGKANDKYKTTAAPGELILFVRERNFKERSSDFTH
jgi:hypothetical protein